MNTHLYNIIRDVYLPDLFAGCPRDSWVCGVKFAHYVLPLRLMHDEVEIQVVLVGVLMDMVSEGELAVIVVKESWYFRHIGKGQWN